MGKLNDRTIQAARPAGKQYKMADGEGLTLVVRPTGSKLWQFRYRFGGKEKTLSLGEYPLVPLKQARERTFDAKRLLEQNKDPSSAKQEAAAQLLKNLDPRNSVEYVGREWFSKFSTDWVEGHSSKIIRRFECDLFPHLGKCEINAVSPAQLLAVLRKVEARGALETAHRLLQDCGRIWRYAVATSRADRDITADLRGALPPPKEKHLGALTKPAEVGALLRNIDEYQGSQVVRFALKLAPHFFVRPGNLRSAEWTEFDFEKREWCIPAKKMKANREHITHLSDQVIEILTELREITGSSKYLFPSPRSNTRQISDVALLAALRRMGYTTEEMTTHGFRSIASTNLEQLGYNVRTIEIQLAHSDTNAIRSAYKRDESRLQLEQRRKMMQHWSNWLDEVREGARIIPLRQVSA